ncbi:uncharacterized protein LOC102699832 [Oryza brachyantha]|nr:uncharacterized protein LOC102699832 [Oryza brachyantha]XP_040385383.1 uncharacterized protein LOC102699832 [Oryza brachyantha]XP_040385384.1 uncharacterized protein LOC102699832 [Oryza brachyantha]
MPVTPDTAHKSLYNNRNATMAGSSRSPPVAPGLNQADPEMFQPPERKDRLKGSSQQDTLGYAGAAPNAGTGMTVLVPVKVTQLKLGNDIADTKDIPKPAGDISNVVIGADTPIPQKVSQLKLVKDISQQTNTQKLVGSTANASDCIDVLIPVKVPQPVSTTTSSSHGTAVPISRQVPWVKLVKDVTPQMFTSRPGTAAVKVDYRTAVAIPQNLSQLKLVKDITPHTATQKPATSVEKAIQQKKRKVNNDTGENPVARHKPNINDMPPSLVERSSERSLPVYFSKAMLMDNLRSLTKLHLADELPGTLTTLVKNDGMHFVSRSQLMENLRFLAKSHNFSTVTMNDAN